MSRTWAGYGRVLPEALHIFGLSLVRYQILYFLTEEFLNGLSDKHKKNRTGFFKMLYGRSTESELEVSLWITYQTLINVLH